ncbi:RTA1 domain-containing protein [Pyrenophora tritici-repentis]|uniref:TT-ORF1 multi-domain protein n=1 Tax=Pyrenophora tritici-repentis TaxID=45151 RepID=A0A317A7H1_9PLEO|nr:TT-ORF1 multi-domain protein [Pyrenophora tritici-repentis]KAI0588151.1 RTA1 domain-containing protein [Pyrenophora tritici-repentis]KAI0592043.1 hypothetical protein Alg130_00644 [Pyrenophora tritici-repentis]KAI0614212.1 RTA1 domain-containing protein [Pyrenophora tritici-repentis]KAI0626799.1 RTA1 domain-containing protein [Pyrenophora tritici-repentis]
MAPAPRQLRGCSRRSACQSRVPDAGDNDEETEDEYLQDETGEDDVLAKGEAAWGIGGDEEAGSAGLD